MKRFEGEDDVLEESGRPRWSFASGRSLQVIISKRPVPSGDDLQEAGPSEWPFARGRSLRMIICKRPSILMIICKRPVHPGDHLQEAGPSGWSLARGQSIRMTICNNNNRGDGAGGHQGYRGDQGWRGRRRRRRKRRRKRRKRRRRSKIAADGTGRREKNIVILPWVEGDHCCSQWIPLHLKTKLDLGFNDRYSKWFFQRPYMTIF